MLYSCTHMATVGFKGLIDDHVWKGLGEQMSFQPVLEQLE